MQQRPQCEAMDAVGREPKVDPDTLDTGASPLGDTSDNSVVPT